MRLIFSKSNWELPALPIEQLCGRIAQAGFTATEIYLPGRTESAGRIRAAHAAHRLEFIAHIATEGPDLDAHKTSLRELYLRAAECEPLFINSHTGKDHFPNAWSLELFTHGEELAARHGVPIRHETHRGRALFAAHVTHEFLKALPGLELTADFSHWVCAHESDLSDQPAALAAALDRSRHIHARVGFNEGPQVSDPRNPDHAAWLALFTDWWRQIVARRRDAGADYLTICPEFGPAPYTPLRGADPAPVADAWEINLWMLDYLKEHLRPFESA